MKELDRISELSRERRDLVKADQDIVEGSERVRQQRLLIERLAQQGHSTDQARSLLGNLETTLDAWREHRVLIVSRINQLERGR